MLSYGVYTYICMYKHHEERFQNVLSANPEIDFAMPMPSLEICGKLFTKTQTLNLVLALQAHFLEWSFMRFGKELFIYICICRYHIYIYMSCIYAIYNRYVIYIVHTSNIMPSPGMSRSNQIFGKW